MIGTQAHNFNAEFRARQINSGNFDFEPIGIPEKIKEVEPKIIVVNKKDALSMVLMFNLGVLFGIVLSLLFK